ncbi:MAG TPA: amino acid permease [Thermodesulfobacteriota bacterium]|nr:amino acid permease [Thermodesulfobacteriota bacterium]
MVNNGGRTIGLMGAVGIGVGSIIGGGILVLAGAAFSAAGPGAIIAFLLNGAIAIITALSFAELSAAFPESGGPYVYSKKVLNIRAAFAVGWLVWFATMVASVLYALGAGHFIALLMQGVLENFPGIHGEWVSGEWVSAGIAVLAIVIYSASLINKPGGGGAFANIGKIIVFSILILGGVWALSKEPPGSIGGDLSPFLPFGVLGVVQAMGYTFITLHGFELIAAVAGEVKNPRKTIPRAMIISLLIAIAIYVPLIFIVTVTATGSGESITALSMERPEAVVAIAAETYLGKSGYWLVIAAGILSMLSALYANILASSRIAQSMARDRTLPRSLGGIDVKRGTPVIAISATAAIIVVTLIVVPDIGSAGAAASLIFLLTFALTQSIAILARKRIAGVSETFRIPLFPYLPLIGIAACLGVAIFEGILVPVAGIIAVVWLAFGGCLYVILFGRSARIFDASSEGFDPELVKLRGRSPLVLVPIANPVNAAPMIRVASSLAPPDTGRVLLLSVVLSKRGDSAGREEDLIVNSQTVLKEAVSASLDIGLSPEALITIAERPWPEIIRVSETHGCESLLLGLTQFTDSDTEKNLETLLSSVDSDVVILRAPGDWQMLEVNRILVPVGGRGGHGELLARILGSICRSGNPEITFLRVLPESADWKTYDRARKELFLYAADQAVKGEIKVQVEKSDDISAHIIRRVTESDLAILGIRRLGRRQKLLGELTLRIAGETDRPLLIISRRN